MCANGAQGRKGVDVLGQKRAEGELVVRHTKAMQGNRRQELGRYSVGNKAAETNLGGFQSGEKGEPRLARPLFANHCREARHDGEKIGLEVAKTKTLPRVSGGKLVTQRDADGGVSFIMTQNRLNQELESLLLYLGRVSGIGDVVDRSVAGVILLCPLGETEVGINGDEGGREVGGHVEWLEGLDVGEEDGNPLNELMRVDRLELGDVGEPDGNGESR